MLPTYLQESLQYTEDGLLLDSSNNSIMMEWERPIMKLASEIVTKRGGRVLNIGHGMGIIDTYIQEQGVDEHWIIEPHPDVLKHMEATGWTNRKNVIVINKPWQDVVEFLPQFDGVYYDTWADNEKAFFSIVHKIVKPGGIFSFFNNHINRRVSPFIGQNSYNILKENFKISSTLQLVDFIDSSERQGKNVYWDKKNNNYYHPVCLRVDFKYPKECYNWGVA
jgi:protein arginine N-methyltransferase 2